LFSAEGPDSSVSSIYALRGQWNQQIMPKPVLLADFMAKMSLKPTTTPSKSQVRRARRERAQLRKEEAKKTAAKLEQKPVAHPKQQPATDFVRRTLELKRLAQATEPQVFVQYAFFDNSKKFEEAEDADILIVHTAMSDAFIEAQERAQFTRRVLELKARAAFYNAAIW